MNPYKECSDVKIRAKDIAAKLGISPATVSNALNGRDGVGVELRDRILKTAQEMGYEASRQPADRKPFIRVLILKTAGNIIEEAQFFSELLESIQVECHQAGLELIMNHIYVNSSSSWARQLSDFCAEKCAGIIILATEIGNELLEHFRDCKSPLVALDNLCQMEPVHSVVMNNFQAGFLATKELCENGHRRIGHLTSSFAFSNSVFRQEGYEAALAKFSPQSQKDIWPVRASIAGAYEDMKALLETGRPLPTAFFACNDTIAIGAIRAMQEKGIRIPEDVSMIGMDDTDICLACTPQLSTIHVYRREMGRAAVHQLLISQTTADGIYLKTEVSVNLIRRGTVRKISMD